jgi:hypothetical protein
VLVDGRKIVGIAQAWRPRSVLLAAGTLLAPPPWELLCEALDHPMADAMALRAATTSAAECLGRAVDAAAWGAALQAMLAIAVQAP